MGRSGRGGGMTEIVASACNDLPAVADDKVSRGARMRDRHDDPSGHGPLPALDGVGRSGAARPAASVDDVAKVYEEGWRLGLKAVALYRDGCKASQPLNTADNKDDGKAEAKAEAPAPAQAPAAQAPATVTFKAAQPIREGARPPASQRVRLPKRRGGFTQEARVSGHKIFLRTGEYEDGSIGEIFIDMHKEGASFRSLMNCFAISVSMGLQHGVPLDSYIDQFTFTRFEPGGIVEGHPNIKFSTSMIDYVFRVLAVEYQKRYDLAQVPPKEVQTELLNATDVGTAKMVEESPQGEVPGIVEAEQVTFGFDDDQAAAPQGAGNVLSAQLGEMMGDAPVCDKCGNITVRNGACYRCLNCGNSMGCS